MGNLDEQLPAHPVKFVGHLGDLKGLAAFNALLEGQLDDQFVLPRGKYGSLGKGDAEILGTNQVGDILRAGDSLKDEATLGIGPCAHQTG